MNDNSLDDENQNKELESSQTEINNHTMKNNDNNDVDSNYVSNRNINRENEKKLLQMYKFEEILKFKAGEPISDSDYSKKYVTQEITEIGTNINEHSEQNNKLQENPSNISDNNHNKQDNDLPIHLNKNLRGK